MAAPRKFLVLILLILSLAGVANAAPQATVVRMDSFKAFQPGQARSVQPLRAEHLGRQIEFQIAFRMRHFPKLLARMAAGEEVPREEMEARYLPLPADYQAAIQWAKS